MDHKQIITRQQYLEALEVIDMYHVQSSIKSISNGGKTTIADWVYGLDKEPSSRLYNILIQFGYFEDINKPSFLKIRNAGPAAWAEFCSLANIETTYQ